MKRLGKFTSGNENSAIFGFHIPENPISYMDGS